MKYNHIYIGIIVFFICLLIILNTTINVISKIVDQKIEKIKLEAEETIEGIKCEFDYKNIHYNGICTDEFLRDTSELIAYDRSVEVLQLCMQNPYAYRYELCKDMEAIR